jgi:cell division transport system permease protein
MRSLKVAFANIRRSPYQALSAILVLTLTFFVIGVFAQVAVGSELVLRHFETKPQVIAYLKDQSTQEDVNKLVSELKNDDRIQDVKYVSKQEALSIYKGIVGNDPMLLGTVTDLGVVTADILPASLEISVKDPQSFDDIVKILGSSSAVSEDTKGKKDIDFPQDVISQLTAWTTGLRWGGIIIIAALLVSSALTIFIIIGMKISSHKFEISTMKLLGAKNGFIAWPFYMESVIYSVFGALLGWMLSYTAMLYASPFLSERLNGIIEMPMNYLWMLSILGGMTAGAMVLGFISGTMAASRFLHRA